MGWLRAFRKTGFLLVIASSGLAAEQTTFLPSEIIGWDSLEFDGRTVYTLAGPSASDTEHDSVQALCANASASGLILERPISLEQTPILEWRWRVDSVYEGIDETKKSGDDYPARIYVVAERWPRFRSRIVNYVWSSSQPQGATWDNAFSSQFRMVAVQSGESRLGEWITERRDVLADFQRLHGIEPDTIDALAIMTDCDNAGQKATAWYGPIRWASRRSQQ